MLSDFRMSRSGVVCRALGISALAAILFVAGCNSTPQIGVTLTPGSAQNADAGQVLAITAAVSNDATAKGVIWTLSGAGALSGQTTTGATYTAPATISAAGTATITATSVTDATKSATLTINLLPVSIALAPVSPKTLEQGQSISPITATVSNDPQTKGVTWNLSGAGALSGQTATTVIYTAPGSIASASSPIITATSVFDVTKTATFTVNLVPPPSVTTASLPAGTDGVAYSTTLAATNGVAPYVWSITAGTLPAGLSLSGNTISGTPSAYGTSNFTVQAKDAQNFTATAALSIKINPAPVNVTTTSLPNGIVNHASYSATLASTGGATPITWSVTVDALPAGLSLNATTGAITGTPTTAGTVNFTVQAADSSSPALTSTKALSITIIPALSITTSALTNGVTSAVYSATLASSGGVAPVTWSITVGTLPAGLSLNASTGAITGTPTTAGTSNITVQAVDSGTPSQTVTKALSITIIQQLVITTASLPAGAVNSTYNQTLQSTGGVASLTWSVSAGSLPAGLSLNSGTGAITGTATTASTSNFTIQAVDSGTPQQTVTKALSITINPPLSVTTTSLANGVVATPYNQTLQSSGGVSPITWSVTVGALPGGLTLNTTTGAITGSPNAQGTVNFTVQAADSSSPQQTATKALSISTTLGPLAVTPATLPQGAISEAYPSTSLAATGGLPAYAWSITAGALPGGLTLNGSTGAITGTPTASGTFTFTAQVKDSLNNTATGNFSITTNPVLAVTTSSLPSGTQGTGYTSTNLSASGGITPYNWSITAGSLPTGLTLSGNTISGVPSASGTFNFTVQVADAASGTATANLSIVVSSPPPLAVNTTSGSLPAGTLNFAYPSTNVSASGGIQPYTWSITVGALPGGLSLDPSTGIISGTPSASGTFNFTVQVKDSVNSTATAALSIIVNAAPCAGYGSGNESVLHGQYALYSRALSAVGPPAHSPRSQALPQTVPVESRPATSTSTNRMEVRNTLPSLLREASTWSAPTIEVVP